MFQGGTEPGFTQNEYTILPNLFLTCTDLTKYIQVALVEEGTKVMGRTV